jgi:alpha-mannosidase
MRLRRLVLVGNAHIDIAYRWRVNETVLRVLPDTVRGVLDIMDEHPELTFAQSQLFLYERLAELYPELLYRVRERIREGRWACVGGAYVEPDAVLPGGEPVIRQLLVGRVVADRLGVPFDDVAWIPDSFTGHAHTLPQLLAGCGMRSYLLNRGCPDAVRAFVWRGPDGSELFAYKIPKHYNVTLGPDALEAAQAWCDIADVDETMVLFGEGDHGGGPRAGDLGAVPQMSDAGVEVVHGLPREVIERARTARSDWPVLEGDLGIPAGSMVHRGPLVSQAKIKRVNRRLEHKLLATERIAALGSVLQRKNFFHRLDMRAAWSKLLIQQFHDTLPGTLAGDAADDSLRDMEWVSSECDRLTRFGMEVIGSRFDTRGHGIPFVVVNPAPYERDAVLWLPIGERDADGAAARGETAGGETTGGETTGGETTSGHGSWVARGPDGEQMPVRSDPNGGNGVSLVARRLPALGASLYMLERSEAGTVGAAGRGWPAADGVSHDPERRRIVSDRLEVTYGDGGVVQIVDRETGVGLLRETGNVLALHEESESSSWHLSLNGVVEPIRLSGPEVAFSHAHGVRLRWTGVAGDSSFVTEVTVRPAQPWVEFRLAADWHEADRLLRVSLPLSVHANESRYESPLGWIDRPADGTEWPCRSFVAHADDTATVAVLNDGTYGASVHDDTLSLSVVRSARDMDPRMDEGRHELRYAIAALPPGASPADLFRLTSLFTMPVQLIRERRHGGALPNWGGRSNDWSLPPRISFFSAEPGNVFISAAKIAEDDWNPQHLVVRVKETDGTDTDATLASPLPIAAVTETDHVERRLGAQERLRLDGRALRFHLRPHEIRTFRLALGAAAEGG